VNFQNLKGYDSHFIMQKIGKMIEEKSVCKTTYQQNKWGEIDENKKKIDISVIANNFEKYVSFRIGKHLQFIDSFQFMSQSLDKLSSNLPKDKFLYADKEPDCSKENLELLKKKGVYPYDYMDSFQRSEETELPARKYFYNKLNNTDISEDEYQQAQEVWNAFKFQNLGQYHDL